MKSANQTTHHAAANAKKSGTVTLSGKLLRFNFSPKGGIEGLILEDGDSFLQVTVHPELGGALVASLTPGKVVHLTAEREAEVAGDHPVYQLIALAGKGAAPVEGGNLRLQGEIVSFNYAKHGEVNGVVLATGDFLHLKPDGMAKVELAIGDTVKASGVARQHVLGGVALEVEEINGHRIGKKKPGH